MDGVQLADYLVELREDLSALQRAIDALEMWGMHHESRIVSKVSEKYADRIDKLTDELRKVFVNLSKEEIE